ncbi:cellulose biosynthesis cyclic di-GMP-binding regulatory protein BcsB [uncultured Clostridium sp.]|uniref:cellulose biosynthesis cyclic di-GMP-binding regulatory protein BcsB n=1 Tax=uncultured Clostridium sp. TaxID=59620 RepID=UPI00261B6FE2|nr:cellulose biosynthesis cyclic di-GMP-binding regulatory protein BcsB [uncultured Clostridium sp.]
MKKKIGSIFLAVALVFMLVITSNGITANATPNSNEQKTFSLNSDIVFSGDFSSHEIYFNVSKWWQVNSADMTVKFTRSQIQSENTQTFFVFYINNIPFRTEQVYYKGNDEVQTLNLNVPTRLFKEGSNTLKIEAYMRISDMPCVDDVNPANWATINQGTNITVNFANKASNNNIANFPYPYIRENNNPSVNTQIVVPNNYKNFDVSNAFLLNSYLGRLFTQGDYSGQIVKANDIDKNDNLIYIGNYSDLPNELKSKLGNPNVDYNNEALIEQIDSPYNQGNKVLFVLSDNSEMLNKATRVLMNPSLTLQLNNSYVVNKDVQELQTVNGVSDKITLQDMGADGAYLEGPFTRSVDIGYKMPKNRVLTSGGKIYLNMRYSQNLDYSKALVSVYINGVPIGSKSLEASKANGDTLELTIPSDVKVTSYLNIEIAFNLAVPNEWCEKRQVKAPWAYVTPDSYIYLPTVQTKEYSFNRYPNPYVQDDSFNNVLVVTPNNMNSTDLTKLGDMFALMGQSTKYNVGDITVENGSNVTDLKNDDNLIVYGTPNNNPFIKDINSNLWFKYNSNYNGFESNAKQYLTEPFNSEISTFQISKSPFNDQRGMLVMTAPNEGNLENSMLYLDSSKKILELTGDSAIIDQNGTVQNYQMVKPEDNAPVFKSIENSNTLTKVLLGLFGLVVILVVVSALLYFNKYKKEKNGTERKSKKNK